MCLDISATLWVKCSEHLLSFEFDFCYQFQHHLDCRGLRQQSMWSSSVIYILDWAQQPLQSLAELS